MTKQYWLVKSEPEEFSIDDLARVKVEPWSGVRSMFARMHLRAMKVGDEVLFYHSNAVPPGVAGLARVHRTNVIDETQFDPKSKYFDEKSTREKPTWDCVDVEYVAKLPHFVSLDRIRADPALANMVLLRQGRLSVQPVGEAEFRHIVELAQAPAPEGAERKPKRVKPAAKKSAAKKSAAKKPTTKAATKPTSAKRPPPRAKR